MPSHSFDDISAIHFEGDALTLDVAPTDGPSASVLATGVDGKPLAGALQVSHEAGALRVVAKAPKERVGLRRREQKLFVTVLAPRNVPVDVTLDAGQLRISDRSANVTVESDAGTVKLEEITGRVDVRSKAGTVRCHAIHGPLSVQADAGTVKITEHGDGPLELQLDAGTISASALRSSVVNAKSDAGTIKLAFVQPPQTVEAHCEVGTVKVELPPAEYDIESSAGGMGRAKVLGLASTPGAERTVRVTTEVGFAKVLPASEELTGA